MPELMAHDVGALAGKDRAAGGRTMEELQPLAVIKRVEVDAEIEVHGQDRAHFPRYPRDQCSPEIGAAPQCFGGRPVAKLRGPRRMRLRRWRRGRVDDPGRERLIPESRNGSLDDLTSARLGARAGIVLPTIDHSLRLRPAFRRDRACLAPSDARSRLLCGPLGSLLGHGISPLLLADVTPSRGKLADVAALSLSSGQGDAEVR